MTLAPPGCDNACHLKPIERTCGADGIVKARKEISPELHQPTGRAQIRDGVLALRPPGIDGTAQRALFSDDPKILRHQVGQARACVYCVGENEVPVRPVLLGDRWDRARGLQKGSFFASTSNRGIPPREVRAHVLRLRGGALST